MLLDQAIQSMSVHKEALLDKSSVSNPSLISENTHRLASYIAVVEDRLGEIEYDIEIKESASFHSHIKAGKSANAAKEMIRREFTEDRAMVLKLNRLVSSGWKLVSESQSRVKHLIAEATNTI